MFIWLASYPKSGNTMVRSFLSSYFFTKDGSFNFNLIKNIKQFPNNSLFKKIGININNQNEVIKNYVKVQETICKKNSIQFLKTHSHFFNFQNKYPFTNLDNSLGVVYIVRDPRNVVTSLSKFFDTDLNKASEIMINQVHIGGVDVPGSQTLVWTGSWAQNFVSWKSFKLQERYLLIKYEDLISNTEKTFFKILEFIYKLNKSKFEFNQDKFLNSIKTTTFDSLKELEKKKGFSESVKNKDGKIIPFFNLGPKNDWKNLLGSEIKKKIEKAFKKEMTELGYLI